MKLLDFPDLHCPRCAAKYEFAGLTGHGTLIARHPPSMCMDDCKEVRVCAKETDVEPVMPADVQQAQVARDFNERVAKPHYIDKAAAQGACIGGIPPVPTGYVPRVKIDEPVKDRPLYSGQHCTDRGDYLRQAADGNWYYA